MSAQANLIAFDGATTPASHTFSPTGVSKDPVEGMIAEYRELLTTVAEAAQLRVRFTKRLLKNGETRVNVMLAVPYMEAISGQNASGYTAASKVAYENKYHFTEYFSPRTTIAEQRFGRQLLVNLVNGVATTVNPVTLGNVPELLDQRIFPS